MGHSHQRMIFFLRDERLSVAVRHSTVVRNGFELLTDCCDEMSDVRCWIVVLAARVKEPVSRFMMDCRGSKSIDNLQHTSNPEFVLSIRQHNSSTWLVTFVDGLMSAGGVDVEKDEHVDENLEAHPTSVRILLSSSAIHRWSQT